MDFDRIKNISFTGWALVVAGAAFGGAVLHQSRLVGGLVVGGLAFAYAYSEAPCCAGCAGKTAVGCAGAANNTSAQPASSATSGVPTMTATGTIVQQGRMSVPPLPADYVGSSPAATVNPLEIWTAPPFSGGDPDPSPPAGSSSGCAGCS